MAALVPSNGIVKITNTTDTFTAPNGSVTVNPRAAILYGSAVSQFVLKDADGIVLLEMGIGTAKTHQMLDEHFFSGMRPWKTPLQASTCTAGARFYLYI